jgi:hypothetical protein
LKNTLVDIARALSHIRDAEMINRVKMSESIVRDVNFGL